MRSPHREPVEAAVDLFDRERTDAAAWMLGDERRRAKARGDADRLVEIDNAVRDMRTRLDGDPRLAAFDAHLDGRESLAPPVDLVMPFVKTPKRRRSRLEAGVLTVLIAVAGVAITFCVFVIGYYAAGITVATVAGYAMQVVILSFATLRAYPPGAKRPMVRLLLLTLLFSAVVPLIYLGWLWATRKKWPEDGAEIHLREIPPAASTVED